MLIELLELPTTLSPLQQIIFSSVSWSIWALISYKTKIIKNPQKCEAYCVNSFLYVYNIWEIKIRRIIIIDCFTFARLLVFRIVRGRALLDRNKQICYFGTYFNQNFISFLSWTQFYIELIKKTAKFSKKLSFWAAGGVFYSVVIRHYRTIVQLIVNLGLPQKQDHPSMNVAPDLKKSSMVFRSF